MTTRIISGLLIATLAWTQTARAAQHGVLKRNPSQKLSRDYGSTKSHLFDTSHLELLNKNREKRTHSAPPALAVHSATAAPTSPSTLRVGVSRIGYILKELCTTEETFKQDLEILTELMIPRLEVDHLKLAHKHPSLLSLVTPRGQEKEAELSEDLATLKAQLAFLKKEQEILNEILATSRVLAKAFLPGCELDPKTTMTQEEWEPLVQSVAQAIRHAIEHAKFHYDRYLSSYSKLNAQGERKTRSLEARELELAREADFRALRPNSSQPKYFELSITPLQRLPRLVLLMGDLLKALPPQEPPSTTYRNLAFSQYRVGVILAAINAHQHVLSIEERDELEYRRIELIGTQKEVSSELEAINRQLDESREAQAIYETEFSRNPL